MDDKRREREAVRYRQGISAEAEQQFPDWQDDDALEKLAAQTIADGDSVVAMALARGVTRLLAEKRNETT